LHAIERAQSKRVRASIDLEVSMQCRWIVSPTYFVPVAGARQNTISMKAYKEEEERGTIFECIDDLQQMHFFSAF
jgi:hypothetical protein